MTDIETTARELARVLDNCVVNWRALGGSPDPWLTDADAVLATAAALGLLTPTPTMRTHGWLGPVLHDRVTALVRRSKSPEKP